MQKQPIEQYHTIKLLILEDVPEDAELMRRELENAGYILKYVVADDKTTFTAGLENFQPDVILADYMLPTFSGLEALVISKDLEPDIPFVFVTGAVGEEIAAETILSGASGFVLKSNLGKLPEVIRDIFSGEEKWYNKRLARTNKRIGDRVKSNVKLLEKIYLFLESQKEMESPTDKELREAMNEILHLEKKSPQKKKNN
ncbi:response regulator [Rapidithrix thailandica]|uniref:Response regulator n=1 Tax=Rapidithrix thailandica TaxID=413964 RepID=A0AAW9S0R7_9BACT